MKDYKELKQFRDVPAEEFRKPMLIKTCHAYYKDSYWNDDDVLVHVWDWYPLCPRCGVSTDRDYQRFCDNCGQRLKWNYSKMKPVVVGKGPCEVIEDEDDVEDDWIPVRMLK